jgi:hypothetical protein
MTITAEEELLETAARRLSDTTDLQAEVRYSESRTIGGQLRISAPQSPGYLYVAEAKRNLRPSSIGAVVLQLRELPQPALLVADYVNPNIAATLASERVEFLDTVGNAYLNQPGLFVWVTGRKPSTIIGASRVAPSGVRGYAPTGGFKPSSLQVIFALLCTPGLESSPYRDIASAAGVALGTVTWTMSELRERGYLHQRGRTYRRLTHKAALQDKWVTAFIDRLRPKLHLGNFTMLEPRNEWWSRLAADSLDVVWSGEVAAWKMMGYLRPERATLYSAELPAGFLKEHRLARSAEGELQIFRRFWGFESNVANHQLAPPLLVYADLIASGDSRNLEAAREIHGRYLSDSDTGR